MVLALLMCFGGLAIWPIYQLTVRKWTRCSTYLAVCFSLQVLGSAIIYLLMEGARATSRDYWMLSALYPPLNGLLSIFQMMGLLVGIPIDLWSKRAKKEEERQSENQSPLS
jgi:hypothetical protein